MNFVTKQPKFMGDFDVVKGLLKLGLYVGPKGQVWLALISGQLLQACHKRPAIRGAFLAMTNRYIAWHP
jgi:hypothetical protein